MKTFNQQLKYVFAIAAILGYIALSVFGLFFMTQHMSHENAPMVNCPYMVGEHSLCSMSAIEHISAWQSASITTLSMVTIFIVVLATFFIARSFHLLHLESELYIKKRKKEKVIPLLSILYSDGLLNPKAP